MRLRLVIAGIGLALAGSAASAFQEQSVGGAAKPAAAPSVSVTDPAAVAAPVVPVAPSGTEIRIPGLGKLGVIPKMDFGLELLYGAADQNNGRRIEDKPAGEEGQMMIRGTIRRNF